MAPSTKEEILTAAQFAAVRDGTDKEAIAEARRKTHDLLIEMLGERRRGGVQWRQVPAGHALNLLDDLERAAVRNEGQAAEGGYDDLRRHLKRSMIKGVLIIATCDAVAE